MAFVFLNRYLDLTEAMDDPDAGPLENADFVDTDIPFDFTIPDAHFITEAMREEVDTAAKMHSFIHSLVHSLVPQAWFPVLGYIQFRVNPLPPGSSALCAGMLLRLCAPKLCSSLAVVEGLSCLGMLLVHE